MQRHTKYRGRRGTHGHLQLSPGAAAGTLAGLSPPQVYPCLSESTSNQQTFHPNQCGLQILPGVPWPIIRQEEKVLLTGLWRSATVLVCCYPLSSCNPSLLYRRGWEGDICCRNCGTRAEA